MTSGLAWPGEPSPPSCPPQHIEKDAALERRFQPVLVGEPTQEQTLEILRGLKGLYERHHSAVFTDEALQAAVALSSRYIQDRFLPDKAMDVVDEAGSRARIDSYMARKALGDGNVAGEARAATERAVYQELLQVMEAKRDAVREGLFEEAALLFEREKEMTTRIMGRAEDAAQLPVVNVADIERVVSLWSGVPVEKLSQDDLQQLSGLGDKMKGSVIGQDEAVEAIARAMKRARSGLKDPNRPIASMLFSGPTGVGKTELARVLAAEVFGSRDHIIRLDMSEYMVRSARRPTPLQQAASEPVGPVPPPPLQERHSVSKMIGAPPGYVGYGDGGKLTEAVRRKPFQVVLFDEIEKAHPDVFNILLQVLEDGRLTDSMGRTVSFKNTLVILTSNIGSQLIAKGGAGLGFALDDPSLAPEEAHYQRIRSLFLDELRNYFRPEFLNRLDEVVVFRQLTESHVRTIAGKMLDEVLDRLRDKGVQLDLSERAMAELVRQGYDPQYGARPLRRVITKLVEDTLAEAILYKTVQPGSHVVLDCNDKGEMVMQQPSSAVSSESKVEKSRLQAA